MTTAQIIANEKGRKLNLQINYALKQLGVLNHKGKLVKAIDQVENSEYKQWVLDLIKIRDEQFAIADCSVNIAA